MICCLPVPINPSLVKNSVIFAAAGAYILAKVSVLGPTSTLKTELFGARMTSNATPWSFWHLANI